MSSNALYQPARRARRIVRPLYEQPQPARKPPAAAAAPKREAPAARARRMVWEQRPTLAKPHPERYAAPSAEQDAELLGYAGGLADRHWFPHVNFIRSRDWLAWLHGWRRGQADLKAEQEERRKADILRSME